MHLASLADTSPTDGSKGDDARFANLSREGGGVPFPSTGFDFPADGDVVYAYDSCPNGKGRLCGTTDQAGTASYEYSAKGELVKETKVIQGRTYVTSYSFDKNGNLQQIAYPSGRKVSYALDAADRTTTVTTKKGTTTTVVATGISHKPYGGVAAMTYGNGLPRTVSYDQQYRITAIQTGAVQNVSYTHDPNGNITKIEDKLNPTKTKSFGYDALDRLSSANGPWGSLSWTYDPVGNRQTQVENGATSTYSYQTGTNKLSGVSGSSPLSFSLDANGNTKTGEGDDARFGNLLGQRGLRSLLSPSRRLTSPRTRM